MISFLSTSCGTLLSTKFVDTEGYAPALMLTFHTTEGLLSIITTSVPALPGATRRRMLNAYIDAATNTKAETILIGGVWPGNIVFMENQVTQLELEFQIYTNRNLCVFGHSPWNSPVHCSLLDTVVAHSDLTWLSQC